MTDLLDRAVEAHGGLGRFNQVQTVSAYLVMGGALWGLKGQAGVLSQVRVTVDLHQEHASFAPFKLPNQQTAFTPDRIAIETNQGAVVEERTHPAPLSLAIPCKLHGMTCMRSTSEAMRCGPI